MEINTGLVHIYHGDGKGKTTCATGLAVRCAGGGGKVLFYQFLKNGSSGELNVLKNVSNITVMEGYDKVKFSYLMTEEETKETTEYYSKKLREISEKISEGDYQLLILDEVLHAVNKGYIELQAMLEFIKNKPEKLEVVLTGRDPKEELLEVADYVTEMKKIKHPFDRGIASRHLIED